MSVGEEEDGAGKGDVQVSGLSDRVDWMVVSFTQRGKTMRREFWVERWRDPAFRLASVSFRMAVRPPGEDTQQRAGLWVCKSEEVEEAVGEERGFVLT